MIIKDHNMFGFLPLMIARRDTTAKTFSLSSRCYIAETTEVPHLIHRNGSLLVNMLNGRVGLRTATPRWQRLPAAR